ncbi:hypothetical protein PF005_g28124 [Phytophthora fragariae]|uniref:Uncharacterized protein n=2 Tax=Phytophthora TaxID=4783 RepID=A0A6A3QMT6_9STRA|nr:hypothetical protein PF006_g27686 [Phytophthora fragariae]KAE9169056.1 hypothetical protein PF005_g28124 [Phytophthora fragariae]KAE9274502.1 hypothetical protein PR003_g29589 [Phytophthora rubi]KAE9290593.1 hypothetical protein PF008_g25557 [Phytophthora fragariae]
MLDATPWSVEEGVRLCKAYTNVSKGARSTDRMQRHSGTAFARPTPTNTVTRKPGALQTR